MIHFQEMKTYELKISAGSRQTQDKQSIKPSGEIIWIYVNT